MKSYFEEDIELAYTDLLNGNNNTLNIILSKWCKNESLGYVYEKIIKCEEKKKNGSYYTPQCVIDYMIDDILKKIDYQKYSYLKILDPSCGCGYFLINLYKKLLKNAKDYGIENLEKHIIENNIFGFDIDKIACMISVLDLYRISGYVCNNIKNQDFLFECEDKFNIILGNPPYIGHKTMENMYRKKLNKKFNPFFKDKADISYCFIKKSLDLLLSEGYLCLFISRYILEALNANEIRGFIKNNFTIESIIDFYGVRILKGVGVDNIIITISNINKDDNLNFIRFNSYAKGKGETVFDNIEKNNEKYYSQIKISKNRLNDSGWILLNEKEYKILDKIKGIELENICESFQGIITGCDKAFIVNEEEISKFKLEKNLLKPWIKGKNIEKYLIKPADKYIIYTNEIQDKKLYEQTIKYINNYKEILEKRRECALGIRQWYEIQWGRKKELFDNIKIVYPYKSSQNRFAIDKHNYFSADVYAITIMDKFKDIYSYEFLEKVLNSSLYEFYIKSMAKKLGDNQYEYYPNKIMKLKIPLYQIEMEKISDDVNRNMQEEVDFAINKYYNITDEEYSIIRKWCK